MAQLLHNLKVISTNLQVVLRKTFKMVHFCAVRGPISVFSEVILTFSDMFRGALNPAPLWSLMAFVKFFYFCFLSWLAAKYIGRGFM